MRLRLFLDRYQFAHQFVIDVQPAGGVEDHDTVGPVPGLFERGQAGRDHVVRYRVEIATDTLRDRPELL